MPLMTSRTDSRRLCNPSVLVLPFACHNVCTQCHALRQVDAAGRMGVDSIYYLLCDPQNRKQTPRFPIRFMSKLSKVCRLVGLCCQFAVQLPSKVTDEEPLSLSVDVVPHFWGSGRYRRPAHVRRDLRPARRGLGRDNRLLLRLRLQPLRVPRRDCGASPGTPNQHTSLCVLHEPVC